MFHSLRPAVSAPRRFCAPPFLRPAVSAPRRFCAPALLLVTLCLVGLALTASSAAAGSYSAPTFDGGYWTFDDDPLQYPFPQANPYAGDHEDANFCGGDLTATSTWTPDNSADTAPAPQVIVTQVVDAYWDVRGVNGYPTASCTDGLFGDKEVDTTYLEGYYSGDSGRTNYSVQSPSGNTVTVSCSGVSATLDYNSTTPPVDDGDVGASWEVDLFPVTIALTGCNASYQALTGQQIQATLTEPNGLPSGTKITSYTWSFSGGTKGNPIKNWDPNGVAVDGTTPQQLFAFLNTDLSQTDATGNGITVNPISFYDQAADGITANCAINLTFPDGTTGSINAVSPKVTFVKPTANWTASATPPLGPQFDPSAAGSMGFDVQWKATITVPSPFSGGLGCFAQIVQPTIQFQRTPIGSQPTYCYLKEPQQNADGTTTYVLPSRGLDTYFPYQNSLTTNYPQGYTWDVSGMGQSGDAPSAAFNTPASDDGGNNWYNAFASGSFTTYLMYIPPASATGPGGTIWVPLQTVDWSWTGSVVKNKATGLWNSATNSSPAVTGNTANSVMQTDTPPQWTSTNVGSSVLRP